MLSDPIPIGQSETNVQYLVEWSQPNRATSDLDHYQLFISGSQSTESDVTVSAHENKTVISADKGFATSVSIAAVNRCGERSQLDRKPLPAVEQPMCNSSINITMIQQPTCCSMSVNNTDQQSKCSSSVNTVLVEQPTYCSSLNSQHVIYILAALGALAAFFGLTLILILILILVLVCWRKVSKVRLQ